jgi:zinc finger FYVE domain-containing protein 26
MKHLLIEDACRYVFAQSLPISIFIEDIVESCILRKLTSHLIQVLKKIDPSLNKWRDYLNGLCRYLNEKGALKLLLEFLSLLGDHIRCGVTYIKLFIEESDVNLQLKFLEKADHEFSEGLNSFGTDNNLTSNDTNNNNNNNNNGSKMAMTPIEISKYLKCIALQTQVIRHQQVNKISGLGISATLFGAINQKIAVAEEMLAHHNYDLGYQIMQEFRLPVTQVYPNAISKIVARKQANKLEDMLRNVKGILNDNDWDFVVQCCINIFVKELNDPKSAEKFVPKLLNDSNRLTAYLACGKLKTAYLQAVQTEDINAIKLIMTEAEKTSTPSIVELCKKFLISKGFPT